MESKAVTTIKSTTSNAAKSASEFAGNSYKAIHENPTVQIATAVASEKFSAIQTGLTRQLSGVMRKAEDTVSSNN